ncbi:MAG: cysteine desulfurase [Pseudomonadota bacterium]
MNARAKDISDQALEAQMRELRNDFPILSQQVNGKPLVFLDSAASSQRPQSVIDAVVDYETQAHANVHRGVHTLSHRATERYEGAREKVRAFINAANTEEIIFTRGTTESINLVANSFVAPGLQSGDEIVITHLEHHANIVPWQMLCERTGAQLRVAPVNADGSVEADAVIELFTARTVMVAVSAVSNALGTILPLEAIISAAHERDLPVLVDGAQAVPHSDVDVQALDADFFAFSAHKMVGPTGVGVLYGKRALLEAMPPWQGGGDMIAEVRFDGTTYNELPYKFEAGTPNISGVVGLGAAIDYLSSIGMDRIARYEGILLDYLQARLDEFDDIRIVGRAPHKAAVASFVMDDVHPHDLGTIVDHYGVAVRTGHHCAMPIMQFFDVPGTARASLAFYNHREDIDVLVEALAIVRKMFK